MPRENEMPHFHNEKEWFNWAYNDLDYKAPEQVRERIHQLAEMYAKEPFSFKAPETVREILQEHAMKSHKAKVAANDPRWKVGVGVEPKNLNRVERILISIERGSKELRSAFEKYKSDPVKYKPQLANMVSDASVMASDCRTLLRTLGEE
jgi:hypothetical protein